MNATLTASLAELIFGDLPGPLVSGAVAHKRLKNRAGLSKQVLDRMVEDGRFPKPIQLGARTTTYRLAELRDALDALEKARDVAKG